MDQKEPQQGHCFLIPHLVLEVFCLALVVNRNSLTPGSPASPLLLAAETPPSLLQALHPAASDLPESCPLLMYEQDGVILSPIPKQGCKAIAEFSEEIRVTSEVIIGLSPHKRIAG